MSTVGVHVVPPSRDRKTGVSGGQIQSGCDTEVTFRAGIGPGLLSLRIALHAIDPVNEVCGAEPLANPYL
jgi:hypothetical protein